MANPVILVTAIILDLIGSRNLRERATKAGAMFIEKPLLNDALSRAIRMLVQHALISTGELT